MKKLLVYGFLFILLLNLVSATNFLSGLTGGWRFNETANNGYAESINGSLNNFTVDDGSQFVTGIQGNALQCIYDGAGIPASTIFTPESDPSTYTVSMLMKANHKNNWMLVSGSGGYTVHMHTNNSWRLQYWSGGGWNNEYSGQHLGYGEWIHLVIVKDDDWIYIYENGTLKLQHEMTDYVYDNSLELMDAGEVGKNATYDEMWVWDNINFSASQVLELYQTGGVYPFVAPVSDTTPPTVTIEYPVNQQFVNGVAQFPIKINGTVTDDTAVSEVWINDTKFTNDGNATHFSFTNNTGLTDGDYDVIVYGNDTSGNLGNDTVTFILDTVNPLINLNINNSFLADNSSTVNSQDLFNFSFTVYDVNLNNVSATVSNSTTTLISMNEDSPPQPSYDYSSETNISSWLDGTYYATIQAINGIHTQELDYEFQVCTPMWVCNGYGSCNLSDQQPCNSTTDASACGFSYTGDYSEFTPQACNYCTSTWSTTETQCMANLKDVSYEYTNTCCTDTGLPSDCNIPANQTGVDCTRFDFGTEEDLRRSTADNIALLIIKIGRIFVSFLVLGTLLWIGVKAGFQKIFKK